MTLLRWWLGLPADLDLSHWRLGFERPWPGWAWLLAAIASATLAVWSYRRLQGSRWLRSITGLLRAVLLLLLAFLVAGPVLRLPRERTEPDWVLVLADRSRSMTVADAPAPGGAPDAPGLTRDAQLGRAFSVNQPFWKALGEARRVVYLGFDAGTRELGADADGLPRLGEPAGERTELGPALEAALQRAAARPVSGVVVLSDGRTQQPPARQLLRRMEAEGVPIFTVPLGSAEPAGDLAVRSAEAPQRAFVNDEVPIDVEVERSAGARGPMRVSLVDDATGRVLDRVEVPDPGRPGVERVTLTARSGAPGETTWSVVVEGQGRDLVPANDRRVCRIELVDRPIRVLYVEGYPRWEYRYLKTLLVREKLIESSVMLLSADRDFAQEGNVPISRLPRSAEEFAAFDLVILGDLPGSFLTSQQAEAIRDLVATRGSGVLWIGGQRFTPGSWKGSPLEELLPFRGSLELQPSTDAVTMKPTEEARRLGLLKLGDPGTPPWPDSLSDPRTGWSRLEWSQKIDPRGLKPTAQPLATTASGDDGQARPLLIGMRYGAGQSLYLATDETWRWRYGRGEILPERFWVQMIRHLARAAVDGRERPVRLDVQPRRVQIGDPVRIEAQVVDARAEGSVPPAVNVRVEARGAEGAGAEGAAGPADEGSLVELVSQPESRGRLAATVFPDQAGRFAVTLDDPRLAPLLKDRPTVEFEVVRPDDELARPETDHALLAAMARETGGRVLTAEEIPTLAERLPNRAVTIENPVIERLWNTPLALGVLLLVAGLEWTLRRLARLP